MRREGVKGRCRGNKEWLYCPHMLTPKFTWMDMIKIYIKDERGKRGKGREKIRQRNCILSSFQ